MCSTLQVCLSQQIKENCNNNRTWRLFFSFSGSTFCREDDDDDDADDGGSGLLPCGSCSPANGTSCDCGCDFIMQIDSCCGFSTKPPLSTRSASLSLLFLSLSVSHYLLAFLPLPLVELQLRAAQSAALALGHALLVSLPSFLLCLCGLLQPVLLLQAFAGNCFQPSSVNNEKKYYFAKDFGALWRWQARKGGRERERGN